MKKSKKPKKWSKRRYARESWKLLQLIVRSKGHCERCGTTKNLQVSHILPRQNPYLSIVYDEKNALSLCVKDHLFSFWHKDPLHAAIWFFERWPGRMERLVAKAVEPRKPIEKTYAQLLRRVEELGLAPAKETHKGQRD